MGKFFINVSILFSLYTFLKIISEVWRYTSKKFLDQMKSFNILLVFFGYDFLNEHFSIQNVIIHFAKSVNSECAKFCGFHAIVGLLGLVPSCICGCKMFLVGTSWAQNFFSRVFQGFKYFLVGILWVPRFLLVGI